MVSDNIQSLHKFAELIGVNKCWFQNKRGKYQPHYDLREAKFNLAIENGAVIVSSKEIIEFLKKHYNKKGDI